MVTPTLIQQTPSKCGFLLLLLLLLLLLCSDQTERCSPLHLWGIRLSEAVSLTPFREFPLCLLTYRDARCIKMADTKPFMHYFAVSNYNSSICIVQLVLLMNEK
jgi:hypothetical protein